MTDSLKLSRQVPAHTKTAVFLWVERNWTLYGEYVTVRNRHNLTVQKNCLWCREALNPDERVALAARRGKKNALMCPRCADEAHANAGNSK